MLLLLAASFRNQPPPAIPQLSVEAATRLSSALHALSTPGGPLVHSPPCLRRSPHDCATDTHVQYPTANVRANARALDDILNPDGSWARRTVYHSFRLLHPYQWSNRFASILLLQQYRRKVLLSIARILTPFSLGRWAYSSASAAAFRVLGFIARTLRIQAPAGAATAGPGKQDGSDHA
jgi:hypothetical protein